jgi:hypothetical protein
MATCILGYDFGKAAHAMGHLRVSRPLLVYTAEMKIGSRMSMDSNNMH